jgi:hypothetical protein
MCRRPPTERTRPVFTAPDRTEIRVSDLDRERNLEVLREHAAQGRLTTDELSERTERVLRARTYGDLIDTLRDLPPMEPPGDRARRAARRRRAFYDHLRPYLLVNLLLIVIWAATGAGYFWPIWPIAGWGLGLLFHASDAFRPGSWGGRTRTVAGA